MNLRRSRTPPRSQSPRARTASRGWILAAYGQRADALVRGLRGHMEAASAEAAMPSTAISEDIAERPQHDRRVLWTVLEELRSALIAIDVGDDDVARDRRLRAAVATAIGAASSLALASTSQPTAGYLGLTRAAVDEVLSAAG